jgi:MHS family proline/betaine transporter-like MFS transporter
MEGWGWRIPFLLGGLIAPVGVYMRRQINESPAYRRATAMAAPVRATLVGIPIVKTAQAFGFMVVSAVQFYIFLAYMPTFVQRHAGLSFAAVVTIQLLIGLAISLYCGALPSAIVEIFETRRRTTPLSIANGPAVAIFGGFAPYIAT